MLIHWIWLSQLHGVKIRQKLHLLSVFRDPETIYEAGEQAFSAVEGLNEKTIESLMNKSLMEAGKILRTCSEKNISILTYYDTSYPIRLKNIEDPPLVLYYKGCVPSWELSPVVGIVGTRKCTAYGIQTGEKLGYEIAACGALVVSGGADGIDTAALEGALSAGKKVVAVLGFGADVVYPAKNRALFARIEKQGCLLTEYVPGTPAHSWNFPRRNRMISGLSHGVVVVEAPERSGALSTARHAMDQGRDLFVVPGNINSPNSAGSNALLRERAIAVFQGWDVVREYENLYPHAVSQCKMPLRVAETPVYPDIQPIKEREADKKSIDNREKCQYSVKEKALPTLTEDEQAVVRHLTCEPRNVDAVIAEVELPAGKVLSILTMLAMKGVVKNHPGKCVSLKS